MSQDNGSKTMPPVSQTNNQGQGGSYKGGPMFQPKAQTEGWPPMTKPPVR